MSLAETQHKILQLSEFIVYSRGEGEFQVDWTEAVFGAEKSNPACKLSMTVIL